MLKIKQWTALNFFNVLFSTSVLKKAETYHDKRPQKSLKMARQPGLSKQIAFKAPIRLIEKPTLLTYWFAYTLSLWIPRYLDEASRNY